MGLAFRAGIALPDAERWAPTAFARIGLNARPVRTMLGHDALFYLRHPGGLLRDRGSESGVVRFQLPVKSAEAAERLLNRRAPEATPGQPPMEVAEAIAAAKRYFAGEETDFSSVPLDLDDKDPLFKQIYDAARRIGWGRTTTYGALAKDIGAGPEVARDVGTAIAKNPVPLIVPCHRVLAAGGKVGGFSAPGGRDREQR